MSSTSSGPLSWLRSLPEAFGVSQGRRSHQPRRADDGDRRRRLKAVVMRSEPVQLALREIAAAGEQQVGARSLRRDRPRSSSSRRAAGTRAAPRDAELHARRRGTRRRARAGAPSGSRTGSAAARRRRRARGRRRPAAGPPSASARRSPTKSMKPSSLSWLLSVKSTANQMNVASTSPSLAMSSSVRTPVASSTPSPRKAIAVESSPSVAADAPERDHADEGRSRRSSRRA